uniref:G-protein coupled receptors family 3 profile domain-containing protein n=1 Tax=Xenopus tropicalis TaxID=8364 RepID=A0A1B8Y3N4_XENTR
MLGGSAVPRYLKLLIYLTVLPMAPCRSVDQSNNPACRLNMVVKTEKKYEYVQEGDIMIGGVLTVGVRAAFMDETLMTCDQPSAQKYRYLVDFAFRVKEINENPALLPNITLGYHIHDSCGDTRRALMSLLKIISGTREPVPNYSCRRTGKMAGFIGDLFSVPTESIAHILSALGYSQISYGATDPALSDRTTFPYFFRTLQSDEEEYIAVCKLLKFFGWNWVGIIYMNNKSGERDYQLLTKYLSSEGICIEFAREFNESIELSEFIKKTTTRVVIICGDPSYEYKVESYDLHDIIIEKTCIFLSKWLNHYESLELASLLTGTVLFMQNRLDNQYDARFREFSDTFHPSKYPHDDLLHDIWLFHRLCLLKDDDKYYYSMFDYFPDKCTGKEKLTDIPGYLNAYHSASLIQAVDMMAMALQDMHNFHSKQTHGKGRWVGNYNYQLHRYLRNAVYAIDGSPESSFNEKGEFVHQYDINNPFFDSEGKFSWKTVGRYVPWAPMEQRLILNPDKIIWNTPDYKVPRAQCTDNCLPGLRKVIEPGKLICCYSCAPCPEGEISNKTDSENCIRCPDLEWPNKNRTICIVKTEDFLSYNNDAIAVVLSSISVLFFFFSLLILGVFIANRDSPIVRANNRSLSFLLLVSIKLSFLSVFLFLGRPVDITCMLRIITFGITFSIAVSSLLAKTIMVCVAFKATKPGSSWRKWLGVKLSNSVVLFCSSIQIIICMTWLAISPPFQELDIHTSPGTIIIQCNEGSAIGFYSVIGYMGLLAAVSFVLAFLARSLPDSFNEAKYITFSMLLFCSVWITMIPAYLSTKGKNTVCVEIFAILTSSAGLLACIFLPKCYTILYRPEINTKSNLLGNKSL